MTLKLTRPLPVQGFTLIEVLVFIIISGLLMSTILLGARTALRGAPSVHQQWVAAQTARQCLEWFISQRRANGYNVITCPSTPSASLCSVPTGFSIATNVVCTTWNSDTTYKTLTVTVSGLANASASVQLGDY